MLNPGDSFPHLELDTADGGKLNIPEDFAGDWAYVMVFRGHW